MVVFFFIKKSLRLTMNVKTVAAGFVLKRVKKKKNIRKIDSVDKTRNV